MDALRRIIESQIDLNGLTDGYFRSELKVPNGQAVGAYVDFKGVKTLQVTGQDYLSLTTDSRVIEAGVDALRRYGVGALGSPVVSGTLDLHLELQRTLAEFMHTEATLVFMTGTLANVGTIPAIICSPYRMIMRGPGRGTGRIFADYNCHESIRLACDICKAHGVKTHKYRHGDYDDLNLLMNQYAGPNNLVVTDGVFSMQGDIAPLKEIVQVAEGQTRLGHQTAVYVDDAHGVGILGENGRGAAELLGVEDQVITAGVLSKAFGTFGGFVAGPKWLADYLVYCSTHMFSLSLPPMETAASIAAVNIVAEESFRRKKVLANAEFLRKALSEAGFRVLGSGTQIVFVVIGDEDESTRISKELERQGVLCPEIKSPAVPEGQAGLRITPVYNHEISDLQLFLDTFLRITH